MKTSKKRLDYLLKAPKIKRTHCYVQLPYEYDIFCPICGGENTQWSEFEKHIWCNDCGKDIFVPLNESGFFSGPIPIQISCMLGVSFDRYKLDTLEIIEYNIEFDADNNLWEQTWVRSPELMAYERDK